MDRDCIRRVQRRLRELGHDAGPIDGIRGADTAAAVLRALEDLQEHLPPGWRDWSDRRHFVAFLQIYARQEGIDAGPVDGWWGPQTAYADAALAHKLEFGTLPDWRDIEPGTANPNGFPQERDVPEFYGPHGTEDWNRPPPPLVKVGAPWTFRIAWNRAEKRSFLWAHEKVAASLERVLAEVKRQYGTARIEELGLDIFSGDYHPRRKRGSQTEWSMHAWGIAFDFDHENNQLPWRADRARFGRPEYRTFWEIWESEGWVSLGRTRNFDWMHVQAARVT